MKVRWALLGLCWALLALGYAALGLWLAACPLMWVLRDGLGPDSHETTGWAALWKFAPMLLVGLAVAACVALLYLGDLWLRRREEVPPAPPMA